MYKLTETEVLMQPSQYVNEDFIRDNKTNHSASYETGEGDGGYLDSFNALKKQIDFNYVQYKEQLKTLTTRQKEVDAAFYKSLRTTIIVGLTPLAILLIMWLITPLGMKYGLIAGVYILLRAILCGAVVVCDFYMLPGLIKDTLNHSGQRKILNSDKTYQKYRQNNKIISFVDEKKFLKKTITEYDQFYELVAIEGLDRKDGNLGTLDNDVMTDDQKKVIEKMRSMSLFKDYRASVIETNREVGMGWILVGFGILIGVAVIIVSFAFKG